jgi:hypothetical protein
MLAAEIEQNHNKGPNIANADPNSFLSKEESVRYNESLNF